MEEIKKDDIVKNDPVPYWTYEEDMARAERHTKRWMIATAVVFALFMGYVFYQSQFEDVVSTQTVTQDSGEGGQNTFSGNFYGGEHGETDDNNNG